MERVLRMVNAYRESCVVAAAVELGVFDRLEVGEAAVGELADALHVDRGGLARLIRALAALGLVTPRQDRASLTNAGRLLCTNGLAAGIRAWTALVGGEYLSLWGQLAESVRAGRSVFEKIFGCSPWQHRESNPALNEAFNRVTSGEQVRTISAVLRSYDFAGRRCVADIGGGHGNLVAGVLRKYPGLRGIVFDLPHVVAGAEAALAGAGVADRCRVVGGSFLEAVPAGADVHILKHVLHNWDDEGCARILSNLRAAIEPDGRLLILEDVVPTDDYATALPVIMLDIHMLVVHGGRERTNDEYEGLLDRAGFKLSRTLTTRPNAPAIIEAMPA
jgi:hypothetical protein